MRPRYEIRFDTAFDAVLEGCADRPSARRLDRPANPPGLPRAASSAGIVHSVEAWTADGELAGGLYGVSLGGLFAGESMFHRPDIGRDASKVALVALVDLLRQAGPAGRLLDVQWVRRTWPRSGWSRCRGSATSSQLADGAARGPRRTGLLVTKLEPCLRCPRWSRSRGSSPSGASGT